MEKITIAMALRLLKRARPALTLQQTRTIRGRFWPGIPSEP